CQSHSPHPQDGLLPCIPCKKLSFYRVMMKQPDPQQATRRRLTGYISRMAAIFFLAGAALAQQPMFAQQPESPEKINLGAAINSEHDEIYPLISPDGNTLYFARKGHPGNIPDFEASEGSPLRFKDDIW